LVDDGGVCHFGEWGFDDAALFLALLVLFDGVEHRPDIEVFPGQPFVTALPLLPGDWFLRETIGEHFRQLVEVSRTKGRIEVLSAQAFVDETKIGICVMRVWRQQ